MDPDENLKEQRALTAQLLLEPGEFGFTDAEAIDRDRATERLVELVRALDDWLTQGGFLPDAWDSGKQAELAHRVYQEALEGTETFGGRFGCQLAYLLGAILTNKQIELETPGPQAEVYGQLRVIFPDGHPVWKHIVVVPHDN